MWNCSISSDVFIFFLEPVSACWFDLCIDVIAMVRRTETAQTLAKYIANSILSNLVLQKICILNQLYKKEAISRPEIFHFLVDHFLTVAYPKNKLDRDLGNFFHVCLRKLLFIFRKHPRETAQEVFPSDRPSLFDEGQCFHIL